jgi:hypothetical protein
MKSVFLEMQMPVKGGGNVTSIEGDGKDVEGSLRQRLDQLVLAEVSGLRLFGLYGQEVRSYPRSDGGLHFVQFAGEEVVRVRYPD